MAEEFSTLWGKLSLSEEVHKMWGNSTLCKDVKEMEIQNVSVKHINAIIKMTDYGVRWRFTRILWPSGVG